MNDDLISTTLHGLIPLLSRNALWLVNEFFSKDATIIDPWIYTENLDGSHEYNFVIISKNTNYKSTSVAAASFDTLRSLLGETVTLEYAHDAFCECMNIYMAMMMDDQSFRDTFGVMRQGLPEEAVFNIIYPKCPTVHGFIHTATAKLYIGFAVQRNEFDIDKVLECHKAARN